MLWALVPRWLKLAALGAILAGGGALWLWHRAYESGRAAERLAADRARVVAAKAARAEKATAVAEAYRAGAAAIRTASLLHDSTTVVDSVTVLITLPGPGAARQAVVLPAIVVRRIVGDSLALVAERRKVAALQGQVVADSVVITSLEQENATLLQMKTPSKCGGKCKVAAAIATTAVVGEVAVRVARALKPRR